ncbi:peptidylprolyl isomerase [Candidatus Berkelbacteria bacterium]|nr:peptidylprolyl isomerase [Candidatus Berkelbacteria bacterium]
MEHEQQQEVFIPRWVPWLISGLALSYLAASLIVGQLFLVGRRSPLVDSLARWLPVPVAQAGNQFIWARQYLEYESFIETFLARSAESGVELDSDSSVSDQVIDILIANQTTARAAKDEGLTVTEEEIQAAYSDILVAQSDESPREVSEEELELILEELYGTDRTELNDLIRIKILEEKVRQELIEQVNFRQILVADEAQAQELIQKLNEGGSFEELAAEFSKHKESREAGGVIGFVARGEQPEEIEKAIFSNAVGLIEAPVKTDFGFHVIEVLEKKGNIQQSFDDWLAGARADFGVKVYLK